MTDKIRIGDKWYVSATSARGLLICGVTPRTLQ